MGLFNSFDRNNNFSELGTPYLSQGQGVISAASRRQTALRNLSGSASITLADLTKLAGTTTSQAELNYLDQDLASNLLVRGTGVDTSAFYGAGIFRSGGLIVTRLAIGISTLIGSATDLDIIGEVGAANCNWGQITAAKSGTIIGGQVTCLEVPAGGTADLDFYSSSAATGTQDALISGLAGFTALVTSGGAWTSGLSKGMTTVPAANDYLYITNGAASGGTFSAGKFVIELYGT